MSITHEPIAMPGRLAALRELRTPLDLLAGWLRRGPAPDDAAAVPRRVLLLPGFGAGERSMEPIARALRRGGHDVHHWGLGHNDGQVHRLVPAVVDRARELAGRGADSGDSEPLVAVGWSLGGYIAREAARDHPALFRALITLGSPIVGGPRYTVVARLHRRRGWDLDAIEREVAQRYERPLEVPVVAFYSRRDGIVAWQACIDRWSPRVRHVEVSASHLALGLSPRIVRMIRREVDGVATRGEVAPCLG